MLGRSIKNKLRSIILSNSVFLSNVCRLSVVQCNSYGSLNVRRFVQILQLYKKLYNERTVLDLLKNFSRRWPVFAKYRQTIFSGVPKGALLSASIFSFNVHGIADDEMIQAATSFVDEATEPTLLNSLTKNSLLNADDIEGWQLVSQESDFHIWRRPGAEKNGLFEYKCAGRFFDVPAYGFYVAQMNLEYRKQWDQLVIYLEIVDSDAGTNSEVVRWVTHFPFPMRPREYVYVRRSCVDPSSKSIVLTSKNVNHPSCPRDDGKFVRVDSYYSCMVIKPHGDDFHKNGFDYVLTYFDNPKAPFPSLAYNWMVTTGVPSFVQKVYKAAKSLTDSRKTLDDSGKKLYCLKSADVTQNLMQPKSILAP